MRWFFDFTFYNLFNEKGEILDFYFTQVNIDNRDPLKIKTFMIKFYRGKDQ
jgi:hypothetical protein